MKEMKDRFLGSKKGAILEFKTFLFEELKYVITSFEWTRGVTIVKTVDGNTNLVYDCPVYKMHGHACHHVYFLLNHRPRITDTKVRWHLEYAHHHGRDSALSKYYQKLRNNYTTCQEFQWMNQMLKHFMEGGI